MTKIPAISGLRPKLGQLTRAMGSWLEPTNLLLLGCSLIYGLIGEPVDALILLIFVGVIAGLDALQQNRSQRALAELARLSAPRAHVRRDGVVIEVPAEEVRLGDALRLEEGDRIAADASLSEAVGLWLDESLLTGESLPVARQQPGERILAGSLVASGRGWAEVTGVQGATELGRLGSSLASVEPPLTRLQRHTRRLSSRLTIWALGLCASLAVLQGGLSGDWPRALLAALALALAVLPNEIPVVLALFLALGALRLARIGVLARTPSAVESLGSATVLAVDKTGTLTQNRMAVQNLLTWPDRQLWQAGMPLAEPFHPLLEWAMLASRGDPVDAMELALQRLAQAHLQGSEHLHPEWPLEKDYPLQTNLLVYSQLWRDGQGNWQLAAKGAPEAIASLCHLEADSRQELLAAADSLASQGLRVLAVATGVRGVQLHGGQSAASRGEPPADVHDYLFEPVGLVGLADPLRADVPEAIAIARRAGVRVVMITGDGPVTARSIADQAGLPDGPVLSGADLEGMAPERLNELVAQVSVFARVMPQQKLQLVRALGLGRRVAVNLNRALGYTLAIHIPIAVLGLLPLVLSNQPLILLPVHIALLHLVIDPACTVVFEALPATADQMRQPPRPPEAPLFGKPLWRRALLQGGLLTLAALLLVFWGAGQVSLQRMLVFSLLLLAGGGLVWLNGDRHRPITTVGALIGLQLWLLLLVSPGLGSWLGLATLAPGAMAMVGLAAAASLLLAAGLGPITGRAW
jgi:P-type Ca2+ transporter type 2C